MVGRTLGPEDDVAPLAHSVVMLGYSHWQTAFGGDPGVVGQTLRIAGHPFTIVGVAPEDYPGHFRGIVPAVFAPRMMVDVIQPGGDSELELRGNHSVFVQARLADGAGLVQAKTAANAVAARLTESRIEDWDLQASFHMVPTEDVVLYPPADRFIHAAAWIVSGVVGLVLLMSCVNLASFLLARAIDRKKEIALRLALGATRARLVAQLVTETVLLSLLGGLAGVLVSTTLLRVLVAADLPLPLPVTLDLEPDAMVLGFNLAVSMLAGLFLGLLPAVQSTNPDMSATIKDESAGCRSIRTVDATERSRGRAGGGVARAARRCRPVPAKPPARPYDRPGIRARSFGAALHRCALHALLGGGGAGLRPGSAPASRRDRWSGIVGNHEQSVPQHAQHPDLRFQRRRGRAAARP